MKLEFKRSGDSLVPNKPSFHFTEDADKEKYWMLGELYMCDTEYILNSVLPNIEKVRNGEMVQDPTRQDACLLDTYEFGYDATMIDFGKEKSVISYGYGDASIEVPSEEIYNFMQEWGHHLREWSNNQSGGNL